jgi:hypothetical protein
VFQPNTTTFISTGTAYLFDAATISQADLVAGLQGGTYSDVAAAFAAKGVTAAPTIAMSAGKGTATSAAFEYAGGTHNYYTVVVSSDVADAAFISSLVAATGSETPGDTVTITIANQAAASRGALNTGSFTSAGWYQTVPEPTSGLLMLVGLGALALRRRRA